MTIFDMLGDDINEKRRLYKKNKWI
jgi:hypothetical protein